MSGTAAERIAALQTKRDQIEQRLKALSVQETARKRKEETRRKIIIGAAVLAHAEVDAQFGALLRAALGKAVTREIDRKVVGDLLG